MRCAEGGGSLDMWNYYFDNNCTICGIDINPNCKILEKTIPNTTIFIGSQNDPVFLKQIMDTIPKVDIIIDDSSQINEHMYTSFNNLYKHVKPGGLIFWKICILVIGQN